MPNSGGSRIFRLGDAEPLGGCQPPMQMPFGENTCENERIGSCWRGARAGGTPLGSANAKEPHCLIIVHCYLWQVFCGSQLTSLTLKSIAFKLVN